MSTAQPAGPPGSGARPAGDREPADGRAARSHRSRRAIVNAMRELHAEGDLRPTAPRDAKRDEEAHEAMVAAELAKLNG